MKKIKPIHWIVIAVAIYFLFIRETETFEVEPNSDPNPQGKKMCSGNKCKVVRRRGILGVGRQVAKDWCKYINGQCTCLGNRC